MQTYRGPYEQYQLLKIDFLGSIGEIAAGNIGAAAGAMERGLARGLSLVISFLAQLLHLTGITAKIRNAIQKVRGKVDDVLLKVAKWIADKAKKVFGKVLRKEGKLAESGDDSASRNLKARVKTELQGKNLSNAKEANSTLAALYAKYQPDGLKSLRIIRNPNDATAIDVLASASLEDRVAHMGNRRVPPELVKIAVCVQLGSLSRDSEPGL